MKKLLSLLLITSALQFSAGFAHADSSDVQSLGLLPGGVSSRAYGLSADGLVVVGYGEDGSYINEAFRWESGVMTGLGFLPGGTYSRAQGVSADGSVVVGAANNSLGGSEAFRWENNVMTGLGFLSGGNSSEARAVSADGLVVTGSGINNAGNNEAFRWESGVMTGLGFLSGGSYSVGWAANTNGSVIVGHGESSTAIYEAFRWENGVMTGLGFLSGGTTSYAHGVSADGSVVVGFSNDNSTSEAFRWENGVMTGLGFLSGGVGSVANAVTADGSIIVGYAEDSTGTQEAFRWSSATGMQAVSDLLGSAGVDLTGWDIYEARGVSADGNIIVGLADYNASTVAFLANVATGGLTRPEDLGASLNTVAQASQQASAQAMQYVPQGLFAAQNISSISTPISGGYAFRNPEEITPAAGGDYETLLSAFMLGSYGIGANNDFKNDQWNGTIGITAEIAKGLDIGAGFIAGKSHQELDFEGDSDLDALGALGLLSFEPGENGFRMYATAYAADLKLEIKRGYTNGAGLDSSLGKTDGVSYGTAVKLGWEEEVMYGLSAMPYVEGRYAKTKIDSYEEQGGAFAASFSKQDSNYAASRVGVEFDYTATEDLELMLRPAWGHRLTGDNGSFTADVSGLTQSLSSDAGDRNWAELTLGAKYQATEDVKFTTELTGRSGDTAEPAAALMVGSSIRF